MTTLAERAATAADRIATAPAVKSVLTPPSPEAAAYEPADEDPPMVPVHIAWLRVRRDVGAIAKGEEYNAPGTHFNFRGVDTTVNNYAPVTLKHGVSVLPVGCEATYRDTTTSNNKKTRECTVKMRWQVLGPMGDSLPILESAGESLDTSDKGSAKAQSVAHRVLLLTGGMIPTNQPDPDSEYIERGEAPVASPQTYLAEVMEPGTSRARMIQIHHELKQHNIVNALVSNELGQDERLGELVLRIGKERFAPQQAKPVHSGSHDESGFGLECPACRTESTDLDRQAATDGAP